MRDRFMSRTQSTGDLPSSNSRTYSHRNGQADGKFASVLHKVLLAIRLANAIYILNSKIIYKVFSTIFIR